MLILYRLWFTDNRLRWIFHLRIPVGAYIGFRFFDLNNTNIGFGLPWLDYSGILALGISLQTPILTTPISRQPKYPPHTHPNMIYIYIYIYNMPPTTYNTYSKTNNAQHILYRTIFYHSLHTGIRRNAGHCEEQRERKQGGQW